MARFKKDKIWEYKGWWLERIGQSPNWYAARYDGGGRVRRQSLGTADFEAAKVQLVQQAELSGVKTEDSYLSVVFETYFQQVSDALPSADQARYAARHLIDYFGDTARVSNVTESTQKGFWAWSRKKGHAPAYTARIASVLCAALRHGLGSLAPKIITSDRAIAAHLGLPEPTPREWIPTDEQLARFLDSLVGRQADHVFRFALISLNTLARPEAVLELCPEQVNHDFGIIKLNPEGRRQTKKRRPIVRLTNTLQPWLRVWEKPEERFVLFNGEPVGDVKRTFKRRCTELGFPQLTPYTLRHKMATELAARGVSGETLARQLGHKFPDLRTTERYIKFDPRHLAQAKAAIEEYMVELDRLTDRSLLLPDTSKILLSERFEVELTDFEIPLPIRKLEVVVQAVE